MFKNLISNIKKNFEIFALVSLIVIAAASTSYFNLKKKDQMYIVKNLIEFIAKYKKNNTKY